MTLFFVLCKNMKKNVTMGDFFYSTLDGLVLQEVKKRPNIYAKIDGSYQDDVAREFSWLEVLQAVKRQKNISEDLGGE